MSSNRVKQVTIDGFLKQSKKGNGKLITCTHEMGLLKIVCIANVPIEGKKTAPVYVIFVDPNGDKSEKDPQIQVHCHLKEYDNDDGVKDGEIITWTVRLGLFQLVFIANVHQEDQTVAPVYVKHLVVYPPKSEEQHNKQD